MYLIGEVAWLLSEQAHRYQEDLSRLGDERDEAVAQHDRDAETIAELRTEVGYWTNRWLKASGLADEARGLLAVAEGVAAALPDPDAQNPEHCQFAAELSAQLPPTGPNEDWEWTTARGLTARQWAERAKSLEAAQSAEAQRDREIEAAVTAYFEAAHGQVPPNVYPHVRKGMAAALDAARAEAGQ